MRTKCPVCGKVCNETSTFCDVCGELLNITKSKPVVIKTDAPNRNIDLPDLPDMEEQKQTWTAGAKIAVIVGIPVSIVFIASLVLMVVVMLSYTG